MLGYLGIGVGIMFFDVFMLFILFDFYLVIGVMVEFDFLYVIVVGFIGFILGGIIVFSLGCWLGWV